jgi:large subunit ribosomal protein L24
MFKFKVNDLVQITAGKDKNQTGKIIKVYPSENKVIVEGKNTYKKHLKRQGKEAGQIVTLERPLPTSKIILICPSCQKPTRIGFDGQGLSKTRVCRKCHQVITLDKKK